MSAYVVGLRFEVVESEYICFFLLESSSKVELLEHTGHRFGLAVAQSGLFGRRVSYKSIVMADLHGFEFDIDSEYIGLYLDNNMFSFSDIAKCPNDLKFEKLDPELIRSIQRITLPEIEGQRSIIHPNVESDCLSGKSIGCVWQTELSRGPAKFRYFSASLLRPSDSGNWMDKITGVASEAGLEILGKLDQNNPQPDPRYGEYDYVLEAVCCVYSLNTAQVFNGMLIAAVPLTNNSFDFGAIREDLGGQLVTTGPDGKRIMVPSFNSQSRGWRKLNLECP